MVYSRKGHPALPHPCSHWLWACAFGMGVLFSGSNLRADATSDAVLKLRHGDYAGAYDDAKKVIASDFPTETLVRVEGEALLAQGRYNDAYDTLTQGLRNFPQSIRLRLLARQACLYSQRDAAAQRFLGEINTILADLADRQQYSPISPETMADAGEAILIQYTDPNTPKMVLERFLQPGQQAQVPVRDAFLTAGQLELQKHDYLLASRTFAAGMLAFPEDADILSGLADAFRPSDRDKFADYAKRALAANPRHVPTLLMLAENLIDAESYDKAREALNDILTINPHEPEALALLATIDYLHNQTDEADAYRMQALSTWAKNPKVDYLIGQKLSQNYRFTLGAASQRKALDSDPTFTPARVQLAQDLLRLGQEDDGWAQAAQAHKEDGFDVAAFNLVTLHDEISKYNTVTNAHFSLRMEPQEARVYSARALALLERARTTLTAKYGLNLDFPVTVEIFPNASDFSVRTFGMPDIGEFLGVTFGPVVTINSPSSHESNWEDVTWHEFMHVVSLTMTHNQMPRWLSEGISVYEESQANPSWGELMSPDSCDRIVSGKMQPISTMSAAFLQASNGRDTYFAYYESMMVVRFLVEHYGFEHLKTLLLDIGKGMDTNAALAKNFAPLAQLDESFAQYAKDQAEKYRGSWDFSNPNATSAMPSLVTLSGAALTVTPPAATTADSHNFNVRYDQITDLMDNEKWTDVRDQVKAINATGLYVPGPENPYLILAKADAKLNDPAGEKAALTVVAEHEGDSLAAVSRLLEIAQNEKDVAATVRWGEAFVSIHPMAASAWRALLAAREQRGENMPAIEAGLALLQLDPPDAPSIHYRVAKLMQTTDVAGARHHVLQALEDAPRFRAAYELLATLPPAQPTAENPTPPTP